MPKVLFLHSSVFTGTYQDSLDAKKRAKFIDMKDGTYNHDNHGLTDNDPCTIRSPKKTLIEQE